MTDAFRRWASRRPAGFLRRAAVAAAAVLVIAVVAVRLWQARPAPPALVAYSTFLAALDQKAVASLTVVPGQELRGVWSATVQGSRAGQPFTVSYPTTEVATLLARAERAGTPVTLAPPDGGSSGSCAFSCSRCCCWAWASGAPQLRSATGGEADMGMASRSRTTFADVGGHEGTVAELRELVQFLKTPDAFAAVGARTPRGRADVGTARYRQDPMARAIAGEAGVPFFAISGSEVTGFLVGLGAARLRALFSKARKQGGVIFIDEIDALGGRRGGNRSHNEDDRTLNQLLVEMDGFSAREHVLVIGATNRHRGPRSRAAPAPAGSTGRCTSGCRRRSSARRSSGSTSGSAACRSPTTWTWPGSPGSCRRPAAPSWPTWSTSPPSPRRASGPRP